MLGIKVEKEDKNPINIIAAMIAILGLLALLFYSELGLSSRDAISLFGICFSFVGTLWMASGVYINSQDKEALMKANPARTKLSNRLVNIAVEASKTIPFGIFVIFVGGVFQICSLFF